MGTVIPRRTNPYTGQPTYTTEDRYNEMMSRYNADQSFQQSFNQGIPGITTGYAPGADIPRPGQPAYTMPQAQPLPGGTPMAGNGGGPSGQIGDTAATRARTSALIGGLLGQLPSSVIPSQPNPAPPNQAQFGFGRPGYYGTQAMGMAGLLSPNTPPGDTYPNGLGGKRPFFPGGK